MIINRLNNWAVFLCTIGRYFLKCIRATKAFPAIEAIIKPTLIFNFGISCRLVVVKWNIVE